MGDPLSKGRCVFANGIPHTPSSGYDFELFYTFGNGDIIHACNATTPPFKNPFVIATDITNVLPVYCSKLGGCILNITAIGLASDIIHPSNAEITVCGLRCIYSDTFSTVDIAACTLPELKDTDPIKPKCLEAL